jgi:ribosome-associated heat shock protein Hsp15
MRIDKYLWCIRVFKTRTMATTHCKEGKVYVADSVVKPAREVKVGEEIVIRKGAIRFSWKVTDLPKSRVGAALVGDYALETTAPEELEKLEMIRLAQKDILHRPGMPTKKDRRDWENYFK